MIKKEDRNLEVYKALAKEHNQTMFNFEIRVARLEVRTAMVERMATKEFGTPYRKNSEMFGACFLSSAISILICQLINYLKG